jgi:hypothetical protein
VNEGHGFTRTTPVRALKWFSVWVRTEREPQISLLRYAPVEMTILLEHSIPRFQERSAELQIPRLRSG